MGSAPQAGLTLPDAWLVAATSRRLKRAPLSVTVQGRRLVLFRDAGGRAAALSDVCPHRNVPLSAGRVRGGQLECGYHGWCFDGGGACTAVPGLPEGVPVALRSRAAEAWATRESQGYVWVYTTPSTEPRGEPWQFPLLGAKGYSSVRSEGVFEASMHAVVENALDVPHTAFLHGGLFRTAEKRSLLEVVVRRHDTWAEAEFLGEPRPRGLAGRLLAPGGGVVQHIDRFLLPCIAQVEYRLGTSHLLVTSALTPETPSRTRIYSIVSFKLPVPGWLVRPLVQPVASRIFAQDARMLALQTETLAREGGPRFTSTQLDVLGPQVARLLEEAAGVKPRGAPHEHRVQMRT